MYFEKENQIININIKTWKGKLDDWSEIKISWLEEIKTTVEKIAFIESKGYLVSV